MDWWFVYELRNSRTAHGHRIRLLYYDQNVGMVVKSPNLLTGGKGALDLTLKSIFTILLAASIGLGLFLIVALDRPFQAA